jgi:prepilin-type N-terminal cleavage/methylation domain-containing protein
MSGPAHARHGDHGFSMVELLVTVVLATIIFAAMVPFFANALNTTSGDARRNDAQYIAQDRIEQVRLLAYADIGYNNGQKLNSPPSPASSFGDGRFGPTYKLVGQVNPFSILYTVVHQSDAEKVTVRVTPPDASFNVTVETIVKDPAPGIISIDTGGGSGPLPTTNLSITVSFKNWADVVTGASKGVYWTRVEAGTGNTVTSAHLWPASASSPTVVFTGLTGGTTYAYTVTCYSSKWQSGSSPFTSPPFHLLKSARLKFDTNPGGS